MSTCDTCRFWTRIQFEDYRNGPCELGYCSCPKFVKGYGTKDAEVMPDGVSVEDDESWGFATAPKFGCIHHEAKT